MQALFSVEHLLRAYPDYQEKSEKCKVYPHSRWKQPQRSPELCQKPPAGVTLTEFNSLNLSIKSKFRHRSALLKLLKSCGNKKDLLTLRVVHEQIIRERLIINDIYVATSLLSTYAKCGAIKKAREIFDQLPMRNVVAWNALITGYVQNGLGDDALECFRKMQCEGVSADAITYICVLKACSIVGCLDIGEDIYVAACKQGLLQTDIALGNTVVDMYAKCGAIEKAREVFEQLPVRDVVSWNALIDGYAQHNIGEEALACFRQMQNEGISPDTVTYICTLKACSITRSLEIGEHIYAEARRKGLLQKEIALGNALVDMFAKCGALEKAKTVFNSLPLQNIVTWNALITGYVGHGLFNEALNSFKTLQELGVIPNVVTYISVLKACTIAGSLEIGEQIDIDLRRRRLLKNDLVLSTALVDMYAKCGALEKAEELFEQLPVQDVVTWTALIDGYTNNGFSDDALRLFTQMQNKGISPNAVTYICILKACGIVGSFQSGIHIDAEVRKKGLLEDDIVLGNTLLDMYAKCGAIVNAHNIFNELPMRTVVSWTALMDGYAQLGQAELVLDLFLKMKVDGIMPNLVTFVVLLTACSHAGLLQEGEHIFNDMHTVYSLSPTIEHYTCMIYLFSRTGDFYKTKVFLDKIPASDHLPQFLAILAACHRWMNVQFARWAFEQTLQLDETCAANYICMANIYAAAGLQPQVSDNLLVRDCR